MNIETMASSNRTPLDHLIWRRDHTPAELLPALEILGKSRPISHEKRAGKGLEVEFILGATAGSYSAEHRAGKIRVHYSDISRALRALSAIWAGLVPAGGSASESTSFTTLGMMLDCSRNAVMRPERFKLWLEKLALLGYNMAMLYTEDTYALPGEPYFGYLRGAYSADEIRDLDAHARALGIELVPCIQTLGHLDQVLKWSAYGGVLDINGVLHGGIKDTPGVMLVDEPRTYELIEKMMAFWAGACSSKRIHIGMDEAHDLARGRFMDLHGYERGFDVFNRHLARVVETAKKHGLAPMIWSDMYFRMGSATGHYYDKQCRIPPEVAAKIPREVGLVYWDYYHEDEAFYLDWIARHRAMGCEPMMASGVWTWGKFWHDRNLTEKRSGPCIRACRSAGLKEILFTIWGDDGAFCEFESAWPGLAFAAELAYGKTGTGDSLTRRYAAACLGDYATDTVASELHAPDGLEPSLTLWDDPLLGIYLFHQRKKQPAILQEAEARWARVATRLEKLAGTPSCADLGHAALIARTLELKAELQRRLAEAYGQQDPKGLREVRAAIPKMLSSISALQSSFRKIWLAANKAFGLEVLQGRLGWLAARYEELGNRLDDLSVGKIKRIEELDAQLTHPLDSPLPVFYFKEVATATSIC